MPCETKKTLKNNVRQALARLQELARIELAAIDISSELVISNDRSLENAFGEKERHIGAYQQHVVEHGC